MTKMWQRFEKCEASPLYTSLYEAAYQLLTGPGAGAFSKTEAMKDAGF